uniref:Leukemia NUP98 fusion partner 1 n=1 Tax=Denticeps clupeoides TaxID=299321 RepID=A0AAY4EIE9_9TELE
MDNDEDDDGNFTKWMSSYWGHGAGEEQAKERKRSFRRPTRPKADRRASLPCQVRSTPGQAEEAGTR